MATNWLPANAPPFPPAEFGETWMSASNINTLIRLMSRYGCTTDNPTASENQDYFKGVRCDENHPCSGIMLVTPLGIRYPFAYCTGAQHKSLLVLWVVGYDDFGQPCYDLGGFTGEIT